VAYLNILVGIDSSKSGQRALRHAVDLAAALNARLTILTVVAPLPGSVYRSGVDTGELASAADREAADLLRAATAIVPETVSVRSRLRHGHAAAEIVAEANEGDHDLLVLGSRGRGRLVSNLLGSVAGSVHYHLHMPLLVIHPPSESDVTVEDGSA
jgi:nucleotide-binding universal stress UspA family protein